MFGCNAYFHVKENKLDPRTKKAVFMRFNSGVKGFKLWCPKLNKIIVSRDVTFDESHMKLKEDVHIVELGEQVIVNSQLSKEVVEEERQGDQLEHEDNDHEEETPSEELKIQYDCIAKRKGKRDISLPARYKHCMAYMVYALPIIEAEIPTNFEEAVNSEEESKWHDAMDDEMLSLDKNKTWELVELPRGIRAIGCRWVYAKKDEADDKRLVRFKARLIAKGYAQNEGIDYNEIFSPVVKHSSIRILLALVAQFNLELVQLDVKTTFFQVNLDEEIYMRQPDGYQVKGKERLVCKLRKSLYGLKQSPRQWYLRFEKFMKGQNYTKSHYDHCVYRKKLKDGSFVHFLIYVDDMLVASSNISEMEKLMEQMRRDFEMKDLGEAKKILRIKITRDI